jgi:hypothetical protein
MKDNPYTGFPAHVLSSFIDLMVSQCDEELKGRIGHELNTLKSTALRIETHIEALKGECVGEDKRVVGEEDHFISSTTIATSTSAEVFERTNIVQREMNPDHSKRSTIDESSEEIDQDKEQELTDKNTKNKHDEEADGNQNSRQESCSEKTRMDEDELSDSFPFNKSDTLGPLNSNKVRVFVCD